MSTRNDARELRRATADMLSEVAKTGGAMGFGWLLVMIGIATAVVIAVVLSLCVAVGVALLVVSAGCVAFGIFATIVGILERVWPWLLGSLAGLAIAYWIALYAGVLP